MTEELIDKLSKIPGLRVPAPTSSFYFKGKQIPIADIAKALGVAYLLDGSVRKSGTRLRVAARLNRADNGYVVWSETYDRPQGDILWIQDDIAGEVTKALRASIEARTGSQWSSPVQVVCESYWPIQSNRGRQFWNRDFNRVHGVLIGFAAALLVGHLMSSMLYGVSANDPVSVMGAAIVLLVVALVACFLPARRASRVDPLVALREGWRLYELPCDSSINRQRAGSSRSYEKN
jgi:hypothetical protein